MRSCAGDGEIAVRPACIGQGVSTPHQAHLDQVVAAYKDQPGITLLTN